MNELDTELLNLEKPTRIREMLANLETQEADQLRLVLGELRNGFAQRQRDRLAAVCDELLACAVEDLNRRATIEHAEVRELERLGGL